MKAFKKGKAKMGCWNGKRIIALLVTLCLACTLSGCWNRRELNTLGILGVGGIDKVGDEFQMTMEVLKPRTGEGGEPEQATAYVQARGLSIVNMSRNATLKFDRRLFFPHVRLFVFGEEVARAGLIPHIDLFLRDHEVRLTVPIYVVRGDTAAAVMGVAAGVSDTPSEYLLELWREQPRNGKSVNVTMLDFLKTYSGQGKNPVVGVVRKVKKPQVLPEDKESELTVEGAAVFKKDKLAGFLDGNETRGYNWVSGRWANWLAVLPTPGGQGRTVVEVLKAKSEKDVEISGDTVRITVKIIVRGRVGEETGAGVDLNDFAVINMLEEATARSIKAEVEHTITKVRREYRSDIFGFGQVAHRKYSQEWQTMRDNWDEIFAGAESTVEVAVTLAQSGKSNRSFAK